MGGKKVGIGQCNICNRDRELTFHHFIPRSLHNRKYYRKKYSREEIKSYGCAICWDCHSFIHNLFDETDLGKEYNSLEKILEHKKVKDFIGKRRKTTAL